MLRKLWKRLWEPTLCERLGIDHTGDEPDDLGGFWCARCGSLYREPLFRPRRVN